MNDPLIRDDDLFAELAAVPIPPVPQDFSLRVHDGVNRALTTEQLCDSLLGALPAAALEFLQAVWGCATTDTARSTRDH